MRNRLLDVSWRVGALVVFSVLVVSFVRASGIYHENVILRAQVVELLNTELELKQSDAVLWKIIASDENERKLRIRADGVCFLRDKHGILHAGHLGACAAEDGVPGINAVYVSTALIFELKKAPK